MLFFFLCLKAYQPLWIKTILLEEQQWYYLTHSWWGIRGFISFPKGISLKVHIISQVEFELTMMSQSSTLAISPCKLSRFVLFYINTFSWVSGKQGDLESNVDFLVDSALRKIKIIVSHETIMLSMFLKNFFSMYLFISEKLNLIFFLLVF